MRLIKDYITTDMLKNLNFYASSKQGATTGLVISTDLSVCPQRTTRNPSENLRKILYLGFLLKFLNFFSQSKFSRKNIQ